MFDAYFRLHGEETAEPDGCPRCGQDIDRLGGNPACPICAAEPSAAVRDGLDPDRVVVVGIGADGSAVRGYGPCPNCGDTSGDRCADCAVYGAHGGPCAHRAERWSGDYGPSPDGSHYCGDHASEAPPCVAASPRSIGIPYAQQEIDAGQLVAVCPECAARIPLLKQKDWESFSGDEYAAHYAEAHR